MKLTAVVGAAALALAPTTSAWRIYLYNWEDGNEEGGYFTRSGPGNPGEACHNIGSLNDKVSSIRYYSDNAEGTTRCCVSFYDKTNCQSIIKSAGNSCNNFFADADWLGANNKISSFRTDCHRI